MNPLIAFAKLIRLPNLLIIAITQYAMRYAIIGAFELDFKMSDLDFFLLSLSTVMIAAAGYIINDYFDIKIDRVNRPEKIIVGKYIKRRVAMGAHMVINGIALVVAFYVAYKVGNYKLAFIQFISVGALWYYSISFKRMVLVGNIIVAFLAALVPLVAGLYELLLQYKHIDQTVNNLLFSLEEGFSFDEAMYFFSSSLESIMDCIIGFSLFAFIINLIREIVKDIEDYEGDKKYLSNTLAVTYGKNKSKYVAIFITLISIMLLLYYLYIRFMVQDMLSVMYLSFTILLPLIYFSYKLYIAKIKEDYTFLSRLLKIVMLAGISYSGVFYYLVSAI